jgi:hypothetical protein
VRLAEYLEKPFLLCRVVVPLRRRDPDLGGKRDGADGFFSQVLDAQLEEEAWNGGKLKDLGAFYPETQVRHTVLL